MHKTGGLSDHIMRTLVRHKYLMAGFASFWIVVSDGLLATLA